MISGLAAVSLVSLFFISSCARCELIDNVTTTIGTAVNTTDHTDEDVPAANEPFDESNDERGKKYERAVTDLEKQSNQNSIENVTFTNETSETGFVPSFDLGSSFPATVIELPKNNAGNNEATNVKGNQQSLIVKSATYNPFNKVRTIKFESGSAEENDKKLRSPDRTSSLPKKTDNIVKFVEHAMQRYQENHAGINKNDQNSGSPVNETPKRPDSLLPYRDGNHQHHQGTNEGINERPGFVTYWTTPSTNYRSSHHRHYHHHPAVIVSPENTHQPSLPNNNAYALIHTVPSIQWAHHHYQPNPDNQHLHYSPHDVHSNDKPYDDVKPETIINVHPISYQATSLDGITHPKTIIYVTEHDNVQGQNNGWIKHNYGHAEDSGSAYEQTMDEVFPFVSSNHAPEEGSVSPWRRIFHTIGTFLPLGLLIALLSPRIINSSGHNNDNSNNEPSIILSKLRVNDLPAEHKNGNHLFGLDTDSVDETMRCEERSICRLLAATDSLGSNFLKYLLLHAIERTSDSAVRKKELDRIFEASKLGKCDLLTCRFYDGT